MKTTTAAVHAVVDSQRMCACGQLLDCSHAEHCPRCGARLSAG